MAQDTHRHEGTRPPEGPRAREQRYQALLEAIPDLIFHLDAEGRFLDYAPAKGQPLLVPPSEFLGRTVCEVLPAELATRVMQHIERALQTGDTQALEYKIPVPLPDGNPRDYEARIAASGKDEVVAIVRDITRSRRAREARRESEAKYSRVFEHVHDVFYRLDMNGVVTDVSPSVRWWGYDPEQLVGAQVADLYEDSQDRAALLSQLLEKGSIVDYEVRLKTADGRTMDASVSSHLLRDADGAVVGIEGIARDMTERKRAEKTRRESEERLRSLVTNAPVIIFAIDSEGVFTAAEGEAMSLVGLRSDEHIGRSVFDMYRDLPAVIDAARRALAGEAFTTLVELQERTFEANVAPVQDEGGKITGAVAVATNITKRRLAEQALRESEERFRRLAEDSIDGILLVEADEVQFVNAALVKMLGYEHEEEIVGHPFTDFVSPEHRAMMLARAQARREGREVPSRYELRALRKDGSEFDAEISVSTIAHQGKRARQGVIRDITERKRADEAIRDSERRYRLLAENLTDVIWTADLKLNLTYISPSISRLLGYTAEEAMTLSLEDFLTPGSVEFIKTVYAEEIAGTSVGQMDPYRSRTLELEVYRKDGSTIWIEANMAFLRDAAGRPAGLLGIARDITEHKRAEEALRQSEAKFRKLAESAAAAVFIYRGTRPLFVNATMEELTGYTREEILARELWQFVHPDFQALVKERSRARQQGTAAPSRYEFSIVRKSGEERWVDFTAAMIEFEGEPAALGTAYDITERKQAEEALRESEGRFRTLSEAALEGIVIHDGARVLVANQQSATMFGCELSDIIGTDLFRFVAPESRDVLRQHILSGSEKPYEAVGLKIDGTPFPVELRAKNAFYQGRKVRLGAVRDITERKRAEEALQEARDELEARVERRMSRERRYKLTFRELTVLYLLAAGLGDKEIAIRLGISRRTASKHVENILAKMGAISRTDAGVRAIQEGLVESLK